MKLRLASQNPTQQVSSVKYWNTFKYHKHQNHQILEKIFWENDAGGCVSTFETKPLQKHFFPMHYCI